MDALTTVIFWGIAAGVIVGVLVHFYASPEIRSRVQRLCLMFGVAGAALEVAPLAMLSSKPDIAVVVVVIGLIVAIPLVAGVVLSVVNRDASDV